MLLPEPLLLSVIRLTLLGIVQLLLAVGEPKVQLHGHLLAVDYQVVLGKLRLVCECQVKAVGIVFPANVVLFLVVGTKFVDVSVDFELDLACFGVARFLA